MNCESCQLQLEDFLYGEIDAVQAGLVQAHLHSCAACRERQTNLAKEADIFAQYANATALTPSEELWRKIHAEIQPDIPRTVRQPNWFADIFARPAWIKQFAFSALLVILSVGLSALYFARHSQPSQIATVPVAPSATPLLPTPTPALKATAKQNSNQSIKLALPANHAAKTATPLVVKPLSDEQALALQIKKAATEYQAAIQLLTRTVAKRKLQLEQPAVQQYENSLALINASIAASRQALQAHPNDPAAAKYLLTAYAKKVELMQEIAMR